MHKCIQILLAAAVYPLVAKDQEDRKLRGRELVEAGVRAKNASDALEDVKWSNVPDPSSVSPCSPASFTMNVTFSTCRLMLSFQ